MPTDTPAARIDAVEALACSLEAAWAEWDGGLRRERLYYAMQAWLAARRAAADAGYVAVMVSKEAVEALRVWDDTPKSYDRNHRLANEACGLLAQDLAPLLDEAG